MQQCKTVIATAACSLTAGAFDDEHTNTTHTNTTHTNAKHTNATHTNTTNTNTPADVGLRPPKDEGLTRVAACCLVVDEAAVKGGHLCSPINSRTGIESTEHGALLDEPVYVDLFA